MSDIKPCTEIWKPIPIGIEVLKAYHAYTYIKYWIEQRKKFVKNFLPYLVAEAKGELDIWYLDESSFNINNFPKYGWAKRGVTPYCKVPKKIINTSFVAAICQN